MAKKEKVKILVSDIEFNIYGFYCRKILHLSNAKHNKLESALMGIGKHVAWTNTEEMNYLSVAWVGLDGCYEQKEREAICEILNKFC